MATSNAPQGSGGGHAEGGHASPLPRWSSETFGQEGAEEPVQQPPTVPLSNRDVQDNIIARPDFAAIPTDRPGQDYEDPYPGGDTPSLGVPSDG